MIENGVRPKVTLYTRPGCGLCDAMKAALESRGEVVEEVNIDLDPKLKARFGRDIPVAFQSGREIARHRLM
jgi:glutaredoxin